MTDTDLLAHVKDILLCCGVSPGQANTAGAQRLRLAVDTAVAELRKELADAKEKQRVADMFLDAHGLNIRGPKPKGSK